MTVSPGRFAEILTTAVRTIKALEGKNLEVIQDELGYALDREGSSFILYLRKGHLPADLEDCRALAHELVRRRGLNAQTCEQFLESAGYPHPKETAIILCAAMNADPESATALAGDHVFVVGSPITKPRQFFGREGELARILGWWRHAPLMHGTLVGARRSGKTSLLHYLRSITTASASERRQGQKSDWLPQPHQYRWIWVDFLDPRMRKQESFLRHLLIGLGAQATQSCTLERFMDIATDLAWKTPSIVLMDELGAGLSAAELDGDFWSCLRSLVNSVANGHLAFLLASHEEPKQLADDRGKTSPFFNMFQTLELGPFTEREARELIASSPLPFAEADVDWILQHSGKWPCLLQILCRERLMALEGNDISEDWKRVGLHRVAPFRYLLQSA